MLYIFLADGFEEIEALTVVDVLRRADINVQMVSINKDLNVNGAHGIKVTADCIVDDVKSSDVEMIILPGGMPGTTNLMENEKLQLLIKDAVDNKKWICAICAAPMILGDKGYLKNKNATCYPGFEKYIKGGVMKDSNVVIDGKFITSKGPGTAMDFALKIVSMIKDSDTAHKLKIGMQYKK